MNIPLTVVPLFIYKTQLVFIVRAKEFYFLSITQK